MTHLIRQLVSTITDIFLVYFLVFSDEKENVGDPSPGHLALV